MSACHCLRFLAIRDCVIARHLGSRDWPGKYSSTIGIAWYTRRSCYCSASTNGSNVVVTLVCPFRQVALKYSQCLLASDSGFLAHMRLAELAMQFHSTIAVLPALRVVALLNTRPGRRFSWIKAVPKTGCCDTWDFGSEKDHFSTPKSLCDFDKCQRLVE